MGDGSLSQEEIDALLSMGDDADSGAAPAPPAKGAPPGGDDIDLDSLVGGATAEQAEGGLDLQALDELAGAVADSGSQTAQVSGESGAVGTGATDQDNVDLLMDVTLRFTVELGRTHMYIKDILQLTEGSIVELDKNAGDEVEILINDRLFGRGKLIVLDEYFAVQITHILDPLERFRVF